MPSQCQKIKDLATKECGSIFASLYKKCRVGQGVKTPPFHGGITGSSPVRGTDHKLEALLVFTFEAFLFYGGRFVLFDKVLSRKF